jgi:hypothetical protein
MQLQYTVKCNTYMCRKFTKCVSFSFIMAVYSQEMLLAKGVFHLLFNHLPYKDRLIKI